MTRRMGIMILGILICGGVLIFEAWGLSPESERLKAEGLEKLKKYDLMDFGVIKDYQGLKNVEEEIFQLVNGLLAQDRSWAAYDIWKERGASVQKRLADRADGIASILRSEIKGRTPSDKFKASEVIRTLLLAAQSRRWADYVIQNIEKAPREIWLSADQTPGSPLKTSLGNVWEISPQDRINEELELGEPIYNNVWQIYFSKMLEVAKGTGNIGSMSSMLSWLEQYKNSKLDGNGRSKMVNIGYNLQTGERCDNVTFHFKMLPDAERAELDRIIDQIKEEIKTAQVKFNERVAAGPCKKMGLAPNPDEMLEELRCTDVAY